PHWKTEEYWGGWRPDDWPDKPWPPDPPWDSDDPNPDPPWRR
ncbi:MAG: MoxR family ATPase, partial [candidate division Zixibacteria bacterium]|nr:MoxR family ATPase [candidate division Zixibacteria bacterium]